MATEAVDGSSSALRLIKFSLASSLRYLPLIIATAVVGAAFGLYVVTLKPDEYQSSGKLFIRPGVRQNLTPESAIADTVQARSPTREIVLNELQILATPEIYQKAALGAGLDTVLLPSLPAEESALKSSLRRLAEGLSAWLSSDDDDDESSSDEARLAVASQILATLTEIQPEVGANVITVRYTSDTPEKAQRIVNALLEAAVEVHADIMASMGAIDAIEEELDKAEKAARAAEEQLSDFLRDKNVYSYDAQQGMLVTYLDEVRQSLDTSELSQLRTEAEAELMRTLKEQVPPVRPAAGTGSYVLNPDITALTNTLEQIRLKRADLEAERSRLSAAEYRNRSEALENLRDEVQLRLGGAERQLKLTGSTETNPTYTTIVTGLREREVAVEGLAREQKRLGDIKSSTEQRLAELSAMYPRMHQLELEAAKQRTNADRLSNTLTSMRALSRLEQLKRSNLQIMHKATYEVEAVGPKRARLLFVSFVGGIAVGVLGALLMSLRHSRVRDRHDLCWLGTDAAVILDDADQRRSGGRALSLRCLPEGIASASESIAAAFGAVPYDPRSQKALCIAVVPSDELADGSQAAGCVAAGLSVLGGKKVTYVSCTDDQGWLVQSLGIFSPAGWRDVIAGRSSLDDALQSTAIESMNYMPVGVRPGVNEQSVSLAGSELLTVIDELKAEADFVVIEFPCIEQKPEVRTALRAMDAAFVAVRAKRSSRASFCQLVESVKGAGAKLLGVSLQSGKA